MKDTKSFFVYGTLKTGECRDGVFHRYLKNGFTLVKGSIKAKLFDLGPYPAIAKGEDTVHGELVTIKDEKELDKIMGVLDGIEGYRGPGHRNLYDRKIVKVDTGDDTVEAFTYFFGNEERLDDSKHLPEGVWPAE